MQCGAKCRTTGQLCKTPGMPNGRCRMHGGKARAGALAPNFKHGRFSQFLPQRFSSLIEAVKHGDILDLSDDIVVVSARISEVMQRIDAGESGKLWEKAKASFGAFRQAQSDGDKDKIVSALSDLQGIFEKGAADYQAWDEVKDLFLRRTKMVESQRKRAVESHQMLAVDEVLGMMRALAESVKRHVRDPAAIANISADFARFSGVGGVRMAPTRDQ